MLTDLASFVFGVLAVGFLCCGIYAAALGGWLVAAACTGMVLVLVDMVADLRSDF